MGVRGGEPMRAAVLYPRIPDPDGLVARLREAVGPVEVRFLPYKDTSEVRDAKATEAPADELRRDEVVLPDGGAEILATTEISLVLDLPIDLPSMAPRLRWVQASGAGIGQLVRPLAGMDVVLTNAVGAGAPMIAEFVFARLLQVWKELRRLDDQQRDAVWRDQGGRTVAGATLGIVGLGGIGREVASRAAAFGMRVIALRRHPGAAPPPGVERVDGPDGLKALLAEADAVVLAAPATDATVGLIGREELATMKPGAVLVNVARGLLVRNEPLLESLASGHLGAAVLDVTDPEPLPADSPLWRHPRVYISPHSAVTMDTYPHRVIDIFIDNAARYARGEPLVNVVDLARGY